MNGGIDIHAHGMPRQFLEEVRRTGLGGVDVAVADDGGYAVTFPGCKPLRPAAGNMLDFTRRLSWLDEQGMARRADRAVARCPRSGASAGRRPGVGAHAERRHDAGHRGFRPATGGTRDAASGRSRRCCVRARALRANARRGQRVPWSRLICRQASCTRAASTRCGKRLSRSTCR